MIGCSGPGSEEESQSHEKIYFILREGPLHRCSFCGQCFKLVRLKDDVYDPTNYYYSTAFTDISPKVMADPEIWPWLSFPFVPRGDEQKSSQNILPQDRNYLFVNADEADHIMVDPAYRMEKYKELENNFQSYLMVMDELEKQHYLIHLSEERKHTIPRDVYETWIDVEKAIFKFDKIFNRYEKFNGRQYFDADNHDRRERRMVEKKSQREKDNYTYYFGGLSEQEQMYRDYYETDIEEDAYPDNTQGTQENEENIMRQSIQHEII